MSRVGVLHKAGSGMTITIDRGGLRNERLECDQVEMGALMSLLRPQGKRVVVDRARFERLRELADALEANWPTVREFAERYISHDETPYVDRIDQALTALQPGDRDPLP